VAFTLIGAVVGAVVTVLTAVGLGGLFALMVVSTFGIPPLPSEVILPFAGFLVAQGTFPLAGTIAASLAGSLVGSYAGYAVGRWGRSRITGAGLGALRLEERHIARMDAFFARWGALAVIVSNSVPLVRGYVSFPAGTSRMHPVKFGVFTLVGATPYTLLLLYAGMVLRAHWEQLSSYFRVLDYVALPLLAAAVLYLVLLVAGVLSPGWPPRRRHAEPTADRAP